MLKDAPSADLIAARVGKPIAFSGWDLQSGPKPTQLAVPAGSCYVFDCKTPESARALAKLLDPPNRRSSLFGEKGFGLGVCSSIPDPKSKI
jgi:CRISPR/Cas system CMR-associated protein Cmr3 (group 5 of RAMP superfamily)